MNINRREEVSMLAALVALGLGTAFASSPQSVPGNRASSPVDSTFAQSRRLRAPLDLRVPSLERVMSRRQLAEEPIADEDEAIKVVAAPELAPMSSDSQVPLGLVGSLQWSVEHPTQSWRLLMPAVVAP
jgi:hypothetical protein